MIVVLADSLALADHGAVLMCGNVLFTPQDLLTHSKSQVMTPTY